MEKYTLKKSAEIGPCMDVRGANGRIYAIQNKAGGRLCVLTTDLIPLAYYDGIGNARQIEIKNNIAVISARESGMWIFDISKVEPRLLCHYQTIEFATGITLYKNFVFVSCRQYGVEIVDINDPENPRYIGVIRTGEVQSACVWNDILFCGVWGSMEVFAVDVSNISDPKIIAKYPLSGKGDGVVVRDGILYASTGQNARGIQRAFDPNDPLYGMGNGIEVFDVHDPKNPKRILWDFFGKGYAELCDMWKPTLCDNILVCSNSLLGVFIYDVNKTEKLYHLTLPNVGGKPDCATSATVYDGKLYVSSFIGDLYLFDGMVFPNAYRYDVDEIDIPPAPEFYFNCESGVSAETFYKSEFPIVAASEIKKSSMMALACVSGGLQIIDTKEKKPLAVYNDGGECHDVRVRMPYVYVAFGANGVHILHFDGENLKKISEIKLERATHQIEISERGHFICATCGGSKIEMIDATDKSSPKSIYSFSTDAGLLYGENFVKHSYKNKGISLFWHRAGLIDSDPEGGDREFHQKNYDLKNGILGYCPGNGCDIADENKILYTLGGGYVILPEDNSNCFVDELPVFKTGRSGPNSGALSVVDNALVLNERAFGVINANDISDVEHPISLGRIFTSSTPSRALNTSFGILVPCRYAGLVRINYKKTL